MSPAFGRIREVFHDTLLAIEAPLPAALHGSHAQRDILDAMICLHCAEYHPGGSGDSCSACGEDLVSEKRGNVERLFEARTRKLLLRWQEEGLLPEALADRLADRLGADLARAPARKAPPAAAPILATTAATAAASAAAAARAAAAATTAAGMTAVAATAVRVMATATAAVVVATATAVQIRDSGDSNDSSAAEDLEDAHAAARNLLPQPEAGALEGLGSFVALDAPGLLADAPHVSPARWRAEVVPLLHEYVWWFIGTVLVLAGSVMGVREGWRTLSEIPRQILMSGAFFAYHAGFVGLGALLATRSPVAGRVLGSIGIGLLPIVFVALASLVALSPVTGLLWAVPLAAGTAFTLRSAGRRFSDGSAALLPSVMLPVLCAELPLSALREGSWLRAALPLVGPLALAFAGRTRTGPGPGATPLVSALYGAVVLCLFGLAGAPDNTTGFTAALTPGTLPQAGLLLWGVSLCGVLLRIVGSYTQGKSARLLPGLEVLLLAGVACVALGATSAGFSRLAGEDSAAPIRIAALVVLALCTALFIRSERRHPGAIHPAMLCASVTTALCARVLAPNEVQWYGFGAAVAPALALIAARLVAGHRRLWFVRWGVVLCVLALPLTLSMDIAQAPGATRFTAALATCLLVAVCAHVGGGLRAPGLHYLGGLVDLGFALVLLLPPAQDGGRTALTVLCTAAWAFGLLGLAYEAVAGRDTAPTPAPGSEPAPGGAPAPTNARAARRRQRILATPTWNPAPFDDLSLLLGAWAALQLCARLPVASGFAMLTAPAQLGPVLPLYRLAGAMGLLLLLRALRDRSRLVSFAGASVLCAVALAASGARASAELGVTQAALAALCLLIASLRFTGLGLVEGRRVFDRIGLPLGTGAGGGSLITDGFTGAALVLVAQATWNLLGWAGARVEAQRPLAVMGGGILICAMLIGFLTRACAGLRLRGSLLLLSTAGVFVALTAVLNRIGRPLPPAVIGLRLTLMLPMVWGIALLVRRYGPGLGALLDNDKDGPRYHLVPHAGVLALSLLLFVDAGLLAAPDASRALLITPPLFLFGAALGLGLLCRSARWPVGLHGILALCLPGAALWSAQGHLIGPTLLQVPPQFGSWARPGSAAAAGLVQQLGAASYLLPGETVAAAWASALFGIAAAGLALAVVAIVLTRGGLAGVLARLCFNRDDDESAAGLLLTLVGWAQGACLIALAAAWMQPVVATAGVVLLCGAVLLLGERRHEQSWVVVAGAVMLVHAAAHRSAVVPLFPGPALAGLAVLAALAPLRISRHREAAHGVGLLLLSCAVVYAFATLGTTDPTAAGPRLLDAAAAGLAGRWIESFALPLTLLIGAVAAASAAGQWTGPTAQGGALLSLSLLGLAADAALVPLHLGRGVALSLLPAAPLAASVGAGRLLLVVAALSARLALVTAVMALFGHLVGRILAGARLRDLEAGVRWGRDGLLVGVGLIIAAFVSQPAGAAAGGGPGALPLLLAALVLPIGVSVHAAYLQRSALHVYLVQLGVMGVYGVVRVLRGPQLPPEVDALFVLGLGFALIGVTVWARRGGIPAVHQAIRRFAAALPLVIALLLPRQATGTAALFSAGSSILYLGLAAVERSRALGALGALAANVALLILALSSDLRGVEIYLAPLGLLVLMLGQIFADSLPVASRRLVQVLGGLLFYAPAAIKLTAQLGDASSGQYAVIFGAACLLGVAVGMLLHIRSYLALGTGFLLLDIAANLINAGLRDRRVGFWVLSLSGLFILGAMVLSTLRGEEVRLLLARVRRRLRTWD